MPSPLPLDDLRDAVAARSQGSVLVQSIVELRALLGPIVAGQVDGDLVAFDTETSEVRDGRFTPYGTDTRIAGFSVSYDVAGRAVDFYVPIRHRPYDWRRPERLVRKNEPWWLRVLVDDEGCLDDVPGGGWAEGWDPNLPEVEALQALQEALSSTKGRPVQWAAHNWGFDAAMLDAEGLVLPWERLDETLFASMLTDERPLDQWEKGKGGHGQHSLKALGTLYLGIPADAEALLDDARRALQCDSWAHLPLRTAVAPYACMDTRLCLEFRRAVEKRGFWALQAVQDRYRAECLLIRRVVEAMRRGVPVDPGLAKVLGEEAEAELARRRKRVEATTAAVVPGVTLELDSPETLEQQLFGPLGLPRYRGRADTRKPTLKGVRRQCLAKDDEPRAALVSAVIDYRDVLKEITAFYRPIQRFGPDGLLHPVVRQMAAATTRMSTEKPNVQQVKKKGRVREVFVARPGEGLAFLDFDQIEMRLAAHFTKAVPNEFERIFSWGCTLERRGDCKGRPPHGPKEVHWGRYVDTLRKPGRLYLFEGFLGDPNFDPHQRMADLAGAERDTAKTANFTLLYGASAPRLADTLDCTEERAAELRGFFWKEAYPELDYLVSFVSERLRRKGPPTKFSHAGYIRTLRGCPIPLLSSFLALNYLIQRSAREVFGDGWLAAEAVIEEAGAADAYRVLAPVHDELVIAFDRASYDVELVRRIARAMQGAGHGSMVPLTVGAAIGERSWSKTDRTEVEL